MNRRIVASGVAAAVLASLVPAGPGAPAAGPGNPGPLPAR